MIYPFASNKASCTCRTEIFFGSTLFLILKAANKPDACPICITQGWSLVVPFTIFETLIDFSATIKLLTAFGIKAPNGMLKEGTGKNSKCCGAALFFLWWWSTG